MKARFLASLLIITSLLFLFSIGCVFAQTDSGSAESVGGEPVLIPDPQEMMRQQLLEDLKRQLAEKEKESAELDKRAQELNLQIEDRQKQKSSLNKEIGLLNDRIKKLQLDIKLTQNKISRTSLQIDTLDLEIVEKSGLIVKKQNDISVALKTLNELGQQSPLHIILAKQSFADFFAYLESIASFEKSLTDELHNLKRLKSELISEKGDQESLKKDLVKLNDRLNDQNSLTRLQKSTKSNLLTQTKNQETQYRKMLIEVNKQSEAITKEIFDLEEKIRLTIDPSAVPRSRPGMFIWPLQGVITQKYGSTNATGFQNDFYNFHNGIDISASIGDPVKAAGDGVVIGVGDITPYAYGRWITIKHNNNLVTLYGHLSLIKVKVGQNVSQSDIIGYAGNTGFSTGPHLHFTVYIADTFKIVKRWYGNLPIGGSVNPLDYL